MPLIKVLAGHTTQDTAYLVEDYPYGFRLRCKIRYWLEHKPKMGFRLVSQTTDPKRPGEVWNKPKASTYALLGVMGLDEQNHVTWDACGLYSFDKLPEFDARYGQDFDATQRRVCDAARRAYAAYQARQAARATAAPVTPAPVLYECQNCNEKSTLEALVNVDAIPGIHERVAPGEPMPAGECPHCGALCHEIEVTARA